VRLSDDKSSSSFFASAQQRQGCLSGAVRSSGAQQARGVGLVVVQNSCSGGAPAAYLPMLCSGNAPPRRRGPARPPLCAARRAPPPRRRRVAAPPPPPPTPPPPTAPAYRSVYRRAVDSGRPGPCDDLFSGGPGPRPAGLQLYSVVLYCVVLCACGPAYY
jgi:hypothetical protein